MNKDRPERKKLTNVPWVAWELLAGIWFFLLIMLLIVFLFPEELIKFDKLDFVLGLMIGGVASSAGTYHLWYTLNQALLLGAGGAVKKLTIHNTLRYFSYAALLAIAGIQGRPNVIAVFLGIFATKPGAYMQPLFHKLTVKLSERMRLSRNRNSE